MIPNDLADNKNGRKGLPVLNSLSLTVLKTILSLLSSDAKWNSSLETKMTQLSMPVKWKGPPFRYLAQLISFIVEAFSCFKHFKTSSFASSKTPPSPPSAPPPRPPEAGASAKALKNMGLAPSESALIGWWEGPVGAVVEDWLLRGGTPFLVTRRASPAPPWQPPGGWRRRLYGQ